MSNSKVELIQFLADSSVSDLWEETQWSLMVRQARRANLLSRVADSRADTIPAKAALHLKNASLVSDANARSVRVEVEEIYRLLAKQDIPCVLLKGAAYLYMGLTLGKSRVYSDVDIMVPKTKLNDAEILFIENGWMTTKLNAYDQKYYRKWMHELPPLRNLKRQTSLDVHHTIIPPTSKYDLDTNKLWKTCQEIEGYTGLYVLSPPDMLLHSAVHLFSDGDFEHGLRDLSDQALLITEYSVRDNFWDELFARAEELDLIVPLFYALRYCHLLLDTKVPIQELRRSQRLAKCPSLKVKFMDKLFISGLKPRHNSCRNVFSFFALTLLYIRSHYLRMPMHLLIPHLVLKAIRQDSKN